MFSQSLMRSIILTLLASSAVVLSQGTAAKTNGTSGKPSGTVPSQSPSPSTNKTGSAKPKSDSPNQKVIVCTAGWAPVGDSSKSHKPPVTSAPKTNTPTPGKPSNSSKIQAPRRRATDPAKAPAADNHKSLCDTAKERYTCSTANCKPSGGKNLAEATGCKGDSKKAQCLAYRPGVKGGQISLEAHTPHPTESEGWIECAALHKIDPKAGRNQKVDTIACQKLSIPMECTGCEKMNSTKVEKPAPRTIDPSHNATKTNPAAKPKASGVGAPANGTKSETGGKPKTGTGSKTNGTTITPPSSGGATKSDPNAKPKPSASAGASSKTNGTDSTPPSKTPKTTQPLNSQPAKNAARQ
ncbi:uncharacterized protein MELLADRAFT_104703 [Melampsora larici-populina 98AG31]|uniref:Secreted protein n=1 Tax=Melampsora larici-populina (strain 98AG31 / pathotype 3-4-7) TaxID=747676 RepID=F4RFM0_MELLP|nr:uncharacterized protein MELLADRAFT_104703 [Melampsora larici-populina 98AG31]EGG08832.1 hypothetical protein MELLADRAFT_104703 [Melampsora larici-populina 98AG31]